MSEGIAPRPTPQSRVIERIASHRDPLRRVLARGSGSVRRRPPVLELYYEPGDPHSRLCAQLLPRLQERVRTPIVVRLVGQSAVADYPEPERQRAYALADAARIAPARGLAFPDDACVPSVAARIAAAAALADRTGDPAAFAAREAELAAELFAPGAAPPPPPPAAPPPSPPRGPGLAAELFAGGEPPLSRDPAPIDALLRRNARRRARLGHYLPAMWQFDGDWFWALDRLDHLEARVREHDLLAGNAPLSELHPERAVLPAVGEPLVPLEFFYRVR